MGKKEHIPEKTTKKSHSIDVGGHIGSIRLLDDGAPAYELRIDKEGKWFHEGVEIIREDIRDHFSRHLVLCEDGSYCVRIGNDECPVIVEDVPFVVVRATKEAGGGLTLVLNDGHKEPLIAGTIRFGPSNIPYCRVLNGMEARFSRPAYYQLAELIEYDESKDKYLLVINNEAFELEATENGAR